MSTLVLLRHGQSVWNQRNVFTGWVDVPLSKEGIGEASGAGMKMRDISFGAVYCSVQIRAIQTALIALAENRDPKTPVLLHKEGLMKERTGIYGQESLDNILPVYTDWHLNERYYGSLQGLDKAETARKYGDETVHRWRRSYDTSPPDGESLKDTAERTLPYFRERILSDLQDGKNVLVSAHGNSLRSIVMFIEALSTEEVLSLEIPTGQPLFYAFENSRLLRRKA